MKKLIALLFLTGIMTINLSANGIVEEKDIPDTEIQFVLPGILIGTFQFPQDNIVKNISRSLEIYENNKYILRHAGPDYARNDYGYIILENNDYYFLPIDGNLIHNKTKITFNKNGFSFIGFLNIEYFAVKEIKYE
ncbi:hypothetical protein FACS1894130_09260 [Spirochaetia bacterium]|nr:hypothetical protein FACS1894130_09260 [Spirochaetia bacterium]